MEIQETKVSGMAIYVSRNRDLLLGVKLVNHLEFTMQRPLSKKRNKNGDYTLVVYQKNHAINVANRQSIRLTSSTYGKLERREHADNCPDFAELLASSVADDEPRTFKELGLNSGICNRLISNDIHNVAELLATSIRLLKKMPNIGRGTLEEIEQLLNKHQLKLNPF